MPKVSVIIPVYGVEKYIERCARSLFEQTLDDIEYLFIDDCTPDKSIDVLKRILNEYPQRQSQVHIHKMDRNSGQAAVREWGMRNAKGEYIIQCDSDDWVDVNMYKLLYETAVRDNSDIVVCDFFKVESEDVIRRNAKNRLSKQGYISDMLQVHVACSVWNKLVKKSIVDESFIYPLHNMGEDLLMSIQFIEKANQISFVDEALYYYVNNPSSIVHNIEHRVEVITDSIWNIVETCKYLENVALGQYTNELLYLKWRQRSYLIPYISNRNVYNLYKSIFPEINKFLLSCDLIPLKEKIRYLILGKELGYWLYKFVTNKRKNYGS